MKIKLKKITVRELTDGYKDKQESGVVGYDGKLDIRPPYQREFIYGDKQRDAVIDTINNGFPLNVMYWAVREDGCYEVIDGQQRTISISQYVNSDFTFNNKYFHNLKDEEQNKMLDYELMVYLCSGEDREKLKWFETINIAGAKLSKQELRNAVYSGSWVTDAKIYFSKSGCIAHSKGSKYLDGKLIRQEYLETAIKWIHNNEIEQYMAKHQHDMSAKELWLYFEKVIDWTQEVFPTYRKQMKAVQWGWLYNKFKDHKFDANKFEVEVEKMMHDKDVTSKKGIYEYLLTGEEKHLNIRAFDEEQKMEAYKNQKGICVKCEKNFELNEMEADHIKPWHEGGKTILDNCQMLCKDDNRRKSGK